MTLQDQTAPNALAEKVKTAVLSQFSEWATFVEVELVEIARRLLSKKASFAVVRETGEWKETTLVLPNQIPDLNPGQTAQIVSWLGTYDREVA